MKEGLYCGQISSPYINQFKNSIVLKSNLYNHYNKESYHFNPNIS